MQPSRTSRLPGAKISPVSKPIARLVPVLVEVPTKRGYRWVAGFKVLHPETGNELQPYMRSAVARAFCKAKGWDTQVV